MRDGWRISLFRRRESGATAVEFALLMPVMMVCFGAITEGARIYWNYQSVVSGVRDASRYLARITPVSICGGATNASHVPIPGGAARATEIIARNVGTGETNLFPMAVDVTSVTATYGCPDLDLLSDQTPVARVEAKLTIQLPFGTVFELVGRRSNSQLQTKIVDQSRIYGI